MLLTTMTDTSVKIKLSVEHKEYVIQNYADCPEAPEKIKEILRNPDAESAVITIDEIKWIQKNQKGPVLRVYQILQKAELILPEPQVTMRNPALEARVQRLKAEAAEKEYQSITKNVDASRMRSPDESIACQVKDINRQLIGVLQLLISVAAGFLFGFLGIQLIIGQLDLQFRILNGIACAIIIAVAELYFLTKKLNDEAPPKPASGKFHAD